MSVRSVRRALAILDCFEASAPSLGLHEIAGRIGVPKSTVFRLIDTLVKAGYLVPHDREKFCLSFRLLRMGGVVQSVLGVREVARPVMVDLAQETGETVEMSARDGAHRVCIEVVESRAHLKSIVRVGERFALFYGATGKVLLAHVPAAELAPVLRAAPPEVRARRAGLRADLDLIRQRGSAFTTGERVPGASAVSAPIFDLDGRVLFCLTVTGPQLRFKGRVDALRSSVMTAARAISEGLGWRPESKPCSTRSIAARGLREPARQERR